MTGGFTGRRVVVIGAGVAGTAAAEALVVEGADVLVSESRLPDALDALPHLRELGVDVAAGGHDPSHLEGRDARRHQPRASRRTRPSSPGHGRAASPCGASSSWGPGCAAFPTWP